MNESNLLIVSDIQLTSVWNNSYRLRRSKDVMTTMGEWRLVGITVTLLELPTQSEPYQELRFYVRNSSSSTHYCIIN